MVLKNQILYVLQLKRNSKLFSKIGETQQDINKRIAGFGFGGKWKGLEKDVKPFTKYETILAPTLEREVKKILKRKKWKSLQLKDRNMGRGYTEWYFMTPKQMNGIVVKCFDKLKKNDPYIKNWLRGKK